MTVSSTMEKLDSSQKEIWVQKLDESKLLSKHTNMSGTYGINTNIGRKKKGLTPEVGRFKSESGQLLF